MKIGKVKRLFLHYFACALRDLQRRRSLYVFLFQAEDGIRDADVTGVQTCALPISYGAPSRFSLRTGAALHPAPLAGSPGAILTLPVLQCLGRALYGLEHAWPVLRVDGVEDEVGILLHILGGDAIELPDPTAREWKGWATLCVNSKGVDDARHASGQSVPEPLLLLAGSDILDHAKHPESIAFGVPLQGAASVVQPPPLAITAVDAIRRVELFSLLCQLPLLPKMVAIAAVDALGPALKGQPVPLVVRKPQ